MTIGKIKYRAVAHIHHLIPTITNPIWANYSRTTNYMPLLLYHTHIEACAGPPEYNHPWLGDFFQHITCIFPKRGGWKKLKKIWSVNIREKRDKLFYIRGGRRKIIFEFFKILILISNKEYIRVKAVSATRGRDECVYIQWARHLTLSQHIQIL